MDKLSFVSKLSLLTRATSDESDPTPGYMFPEINKISFESGACCEDLVGWLVDRLSDKSCHVKLKVLRVMKYCVTCGHPQFRHSLRKKSQIIAETTKYSGPPDPLHGNAPYMSVRQEAKELSSVLFTTDENDSSVVASVTSSQHHQQMPGGMGSSGSGTMQGFGNTAFASSKSFGDTIRDGLQELAYRATGMDLGHTDVTFETVSSVSPFPNYRPVVIPSSNIDRQFSPAEALKNKTSLSKTPTKHRRGVAGGGWEDEDAEHVTAVNVHAAELSVLSSSSAAGTDCDSNGISPHLEDWTAEARLVNDFLQNTGEVIPRRNQLDCFVSSCSSVNCDKVVELLCQCLDDKSHNSALKSLLALEWLLMTDLITADHIAIICSRTLMSLYTSDCIDQAVQQKARKIIRILEKLSPKQAYLFHSVSSSMSNRYNSEQIDSVQTAESTDDSSRNIVTTAFPFLLKSKITADC